MVDCDFYNCNKIKSQDYYDIWIHFENHCTKPHPQKTHKWTVDPQHSQPVYGPTRQFHFKKIKKNNPK